MSFSRHMNPSDQKVTRALGYALTSHDWHGLSAVSEIRLSEDKHAAAAFALLKTLSDQQAEWVATAAIIGNDDWKGW